MRKVLFTLLAATVILSGCDNNNNNNPVIKEEITDLAPKIKSIKFEKERLGVNQVTIIGAEVESTDNKPFKLSWSSGQTSLGDGEKVKIFFDTAGEKELTVVATDEKGASDKLTQKFNVVDCDFGVGIWGDKIDIIERSEKGVPMGNSASTIYHFLGDGFDRFYTLDNDVLVSGMSRFYYTPKVLQPTQYGLAWVIYQEFLDKLIAKYGQYTEQKTSVNFTGNKNEDGLSLLNGAVIETRFSNERTNVHYKVYRSKTATICYETNYSTKR